MSEQHTAPTEIHQAKERFDHSQAFLPWFLKNRWLGVKNLPKTRKLGALAAVGVDYLGANITNTDLYNSKYAGTTEEVNNQSQDDEPSPQEPAVAPTSREQGAGRPQAVEEGELTAEEIKAEIEAFNKRFKDQTYVPSPEEYNTISDLASHICITYTEVHPDLYEENRINYVVVGIGAEPIDSYAARSFLDAARADRWKLSEKGLEDANKTLNISILPGLSAHQQHRRRERRSDFLNYDEYMRKRKQSVDPTSDIAAVYHDYLRRRIDLNELIHGMEEAERALGQEPVEPSEVAARSLESFTASQKKTRRGRDRLRR